MAKSHGQRVGWEWKDLGSGDGYWVKISGPQHSHRLPFFCPHCSKVCGDVDTNWLATYGFCWECYTIHVEGRTVPDIDLAKYKK